MEVEAAADATRNGRRCFVLKPKAVVLSLRVEV
jgi:hypothetical protein